ncbi:MAG: hypothetical protein RBT71_11200, partial [Flavobacteriales bacterium]|nr:hypothetical protein [Flavobacteriales bacterium]
MTTTVPMAPGSLLAAAEHGMSWDDYMELFDRTVAAQRTTGPDQGEELVAYTKLNLARTRRWGKTLKVLPEL